MGEVGSSVRLIRYTPDAENVIADAARMCYASDTSKLFDGNIDEVDDARMIKRLVKMNHLSPIEHASYTFDIEGVSRAMTHQLVRHRLASFSQRSQRYVEESDFDYIVPEQVRLAGLEDEYRVMMEHAGNNYVRLSSMINERLGISGEELNQDARFVLPNACETKIITTMNARELLHFFQERLCNRAQWEIRGVAEKMLDLVRPTAPNLFSYAGPYCVQNGKCNQGRKACGKIEEMINKYKKAR